jgi:hypothetical protein
MSSVVQAWLSELSWKQQSIFFSGLRGPDVPNVPCIKAVNRWMRTISQYNADPSKNYMRKAAWPDPCDVCDELEFLPCHYVHHFADALAVVAYGHHDPEVAQLAAELHYRIAEELFHFVPETAAVFELRHRDKPDGVDLRAADWESQVELEETAYLGAALARFAHTTT